MNAQLIVSGALFVVALVLGIAAGPNGPSTAKAEPIACWSGYHADRMGNCQPDNPVPDSRCPAGYIAQVAFNGSGYRCVPIPEGY